jgi:hypothetical protein
MTLDKFRVWIGIPTAIVALLIALAWLLDQMQLSKTLGTRFDGHVTQAVEVHRVADSVVKDVHQHTVEQQQLLEGLARGECIENPVENLARQGMLPTCLRLGIPPKTPPPTAVPVIPPKVEPLP